MHLTYSEKVKNHHPGFEIENDIQGVEININDTMRTIPTRTLGIQIFYLDMDQIIFSTSVLPSA